MGYRYAVVQEATNLWCIIDKHVEIPVGGGFSKWKVVARTYDKSNEVALLIAAALNVLKKTEQHTTGRSDAIVTAHMRQDVGRNARFENHLL